jgi:hypothetical protein
LPIVIFYGLSLDKLPNHASPVSDVSSEAFPCGVNLDLYPDCGPLRLAEPIPWPRTEV